MPLKNEITYRREIEIEKQALNFLHRYALSVFLGTIFAIGLIAFFVYKSYQSPILVIWLGIVLTALTFSLIYRQKMPDSKLSHEQKLARGTFINFFDGLVVSSQVLFFPVMDDISRMLLISLLFMACTGAITTTVGYRRFYLAYSSPILVSILISTALTPYFFNGSSALYVVSAVSLFLAHLLYRLSMGIYDNFKESFSANLRANQINEDLIKAIDEAKRANESKTRLNEELVNAVDEAKRANESKTRFLASASHDLRQPINVLSLFVANLSLKDEKGEYADVISHMNSAITSVDAQLESLLDISKLDAGIVDVRLKETDIARLVEDVVSSYPDSDDVVVKYTSEIENLIIKTDISLFERILNNLVSNSVKYTKEGYIEVTLKVVNDRAVLVVKDTGIGIKPKDLDTIFDEFYQVGNSERNSENGLGLGLSIVRRLATLLNIKISLTSQYGLGTEVTMSMDYERASQPNIFEIESASIASDNDSKRVLVLDNELSIVMAVKAVLETMNHRVEIFTNSNKALRCFEKKRFDLALIDYRLSDGVLGNDVINSMLSINKKTKFFLITGDNNVGHADQFEVVHKPVTSQKLEHIFST